MTDNIGDQRIRKRVTTIGPFGHLVGTYSQANKNIDFANRHFITVLIAPGSTAGIFSVRGEPAGVAAPGASGFAKIEIEAVNIATATCMQFEVAGFFDAFALIIGTAITGGSTPGVSVFINSTIIG